MVSMRALVLGAACGVTIYKLAPTEQLDPALAYVHGCARSGGKPTRHAIVSVSRGGVVDADPEPVDRAGCFTASTRPGRFELVLELDFEHAYASRFEVDGRAGERLDLGSLEIGAQVIHGVVRDRDGAPAPGVIVYDPDRTSLATRSDGSGQYELAFPSGGHHRLRVADTDVDVLAFGETMTRDITLR